MKSSYRMSLKRKGVFVITLFIMLPLITLGWYAYSQSSKVIKTQVGNTTLQLVMQNHVTVDRVLSLIDQNTINIATDPAMRLGKNGLFLAGEPQIANLLNKYSSLYIEQPLYALFVPIQADKAPAGRSNRSVGLHYIPAEDKPDWYAASAAAEGSGILTVMEDLGGFEPRGRTLAYIRSVHDAARSDNQVGALVVSQLNEVLKPDLESIVSLHGGQVYLTDYAGTVLAGNDAGALGDNLALPSLSDRQPSGYTFVNDRDGRWLYVYHFSSSFSTRLVYKAPMNALTGQLSHIQYTNMVVTILYLLLVLTLAAFIMRSLLKPLLQLIGYMKSYDPGKSMAFFPGSLRRDEIGYLFRSFQDMTNRLNQVVEEKYVMELKGKEITLMSLHSQITPHLLYNTLDSIHWFSLRGGMPQVAEMIKDLSTLLRIGLSKGRQIIRIEEELEHVKAYVRLQLKRSKESFRIDYDIAEETLSYLAPKVIVQPLVENAILHGISNMDGEGEIRIRSELVQDTIRISVEDNGFRPVDLNEMTRILEEDDSGNLFGTEARPQMRSYGIRNVNRRIKLHYGEAYGLHYELNPGGGTIAVLVLPAIRAEEE